MYGTITLYGCLFQGPSIKTFTHYSANQMARYYPITLIYQVPNVRETYFNFGFARIFLGAACFLTLKIQ